MICYYEKAYKNRNLCVYVDILARVVKLLVIVLFEFRGGNGTNLPRIYGAVGS